MGVVKLRRKINERLILTTHDTDFNTLYPWGFFSNREQDQGE